LLKVIFGPVTSLIKSMSRLSQLNLLKLYLIHFTNFFLVKRKLFQLMKWISDKV